MSDKLTYETVHIYLKKRRGNPKEMVCVACGGQADEWAYDHGDVEQLLSPKGRPYSIKMEHYGPMCRSCHRREDAGGDRHCRNGHPWTPESTYVHRGKRLCRVCRRNYMRKLRKKEETENV